MKKYRINVEGTVYNVEIEENAPGEYRVRVGDRVVSVTARDVTEGEDRTKPAARAETGGTANENGAVMVVSPMPGNVESVKVSAGDSVKYGDPVIILEAMKMKNEIPSPADGIVREVPVKAGDSIDSGDTIAIIDGTGQ